MADSANHPAQPRSRRGSPYTNTKRGHHIEEGFSNFKARLSADLDNGCHAGCRRSAPATNDSGLRWSVQANAARAPLPTACFPSSNPNCSSRDRQEERHCVLACKNSSMSTGAIAKTCAPPATPCDPTAGLSRSTTGRRTRKPSATSRSPSRERSAMSKPPWMITGIGCITRPAPTGCSVERMILHYMSQHPLRGKD
jgi:hypothetical protein